MNKILEFMAFSKPIVAFDLAEGRYSAGDAAVYVKGNNIEDYARQISLLLDDESKRKYMGAFGKKRLLEKF